jgi:hypothetical protein
MGNSENSQAQNYSTSSPSYTKSSTSMSVGQGNFGETKQVIGKLIDLNKIIDEVILVKRPIENHPVFHWGFFFIVNDTIVCIEYTVGGVLLNLFKNRSDAYRAFAAKSNYVCYKSMSSFRSSNCNLNQILDRVAGLVVSYGFTENGYNLISRNCQHFVLQLAIPFDINAEISSKAANLILSNDSPTLIANTLISILDLKKDDDSIFYELENNLEPNSMVKRARSLAKMETFKF